MVDTIDLTPTSRITEHEVYWNLGRVILLSLQIFIICGSTLVIFVLGLVALGNPDKYRDKARFVYQHIEPALFQVVKLINPAILKYEKKHTDCCDGRCQELKSSCSDSFTEGRRYIDTRVFRARGSKYSPPLSYTSSFIRYFFPVDDLTRLHPDEELGTNIYQLQGENEEHLDDGVHGEHGEHREHGELGEHGEYGEHEEHEEYKEFGDCEKRVGHEEHGELVNRAKQPRAVEHGKQGNQTEHDEIDNNTEQLNEEPEEHEVLQEQEEQSELGNPNEQLRGEHGVQGELGNHTVQMHEEHIEYGQHKGHEEHLEHGEQGEHEEHEGHKVHEGHGGLGRNSEHQLGEHSEH
ncbi:sarcoplasmic reticulum histidine-rich calcium-binding protein [Eurytemora carolleeae]|uniref:sarcoplasmic reticulum histidine-rich calcium-binding protein n=1 Tax=Eurytemora carolleeae TaxID=1294199 RepID=UPI000C782458|nr:sarcoplasmic reticulum histidine-rich calcium-binding protein [Eurytemora carolleeae]|eukprot:XP_023344121.1 sarcoplasmic reticulum histidine-rich calcium-binding protein-like [Eurytemora affinis]